MVLQVNLDRILEKSYLSPRIQRADLYLVSFLSTFQEKTTTKDNNNNNKRLMERR